MKFLAIENEKEGLTSEDFKPFLEKEAKKVWELQQKGLIREIYFNDQRNAVIILECKNSDEAKIILNSLPLAKNKLISFELMALLPYSGFVRLFK
ncbi:MAG: hypothetical protein JSV22_09840 [Bacteroidales bacterium]|nr:MAG: hypothetical protein JSV22_09840 [Bacteroidales bacterium]